MIIMVEQKKNRHKNASGSIVIWTVECALKRQMPFDYHSIGLSVELLIANYTVLPIFSSLVTVTWCYINWLSIDVCYKKNHYFFFICETQMNHNSWLITIIFIDFFIFYSNSVINNATRATTFFGILFYSLEFCFIFKSKLKYETKINSHMSCKFMSAVQLSLFDKPKLKQNQRPFAQPKYQHNQ